METAESLLAHGRYQFAVFVCHLAVEKALKGLYHSRVDRVPPKVHNLLHFVNELNLEIDRDRYRVLARLNEAQIASRYPDELDAALRKYTAPKVEEIIAASKEAIQWIKQQY